MFQELGWVILSIGLGLIVLGLLFILLDGLPGVGRLPGDIYIERDNFTFYFPITTCILLSVVLSAIFYLINFFR